MKEILSEKFCLKKLKWKNRLKIHIFLNSCSILCVLVSLDGEKYKLSFDVLSMRIAWVVPEILQF